MSICYSCFREYGDDFSVCPYCGQVAVDNVLIIQINIMSC